MHSVSKNQVRLKRKKEDGTLDNIVTVWSDMRYTQCNVILGNADENDPENISSQMTSSVVDLNFPDVPHVTVDLDEIMGSACSKWHGKRTSCCEAGCSFSVHRCMSRSEFDPLLLEKDECKGKMNTPKIDPLPTHPIMSNGYVKSVGMTVKTFDDGILEALEKLGIDPNSKPTRAQIESVEASPELSSMKEYLLAQDFQEDDGPLMESIVRERSLFEDDAIYNCIDHSGLAANSFNMMTTCERTKEENVPIEHIPIPSNGPPVFPDDSDIRNRERSSRSRTVDVIHLDACESYLSAKEMVDETQADAELNEGMFQSLSVLSLTTNLHNLTQHTAAERALRIATYVCVQEMCRCEESLKKESLRSIPENVGELHPLDTDRSPSSPPLSYCYISNALQTVTENVRASFDLEAWSSSVPTESIPQMNCMEILYSIMSEEVTRPFFFRDPQTKKWIRKCSHAAEDWEEKFTGPFAIFSELGRYVKRHLFGQEDRHCIPLKDMRR